MISLSKQLTKLEQKLTKRKTLGTTLTYAVKAWLQHRLINDANSKVMLQRAAHALIEMQRLNSVHLKLYSCTIFMSIESGYFDIAQTMLSKAYHYKSFLSANEPVFYTELLFLYAYFEIAQNRTNRAQKYWRMLTAITKNDAENEHFLLMEGHLYLAMKDYSQAYYYFYEAYVTGCNSPFMYEGLFRYYQLTANNPGDDVILPVLAYAAARGADASKVIYAYDASLIEAFGYEPESGEKLYARTGYAPLLKLICDRRITQRDTSSAAYAYYNEAHLKQLPVNGLYLYIAKSAMNTDVDVLDKYIITRLIQSRIPERDVQIYAYHVLINQPALDDLLKTHHAQIIMLAKQCLASGLTGRHANSLYFYLWQQSQNDETLEHRDKLESILNKYLLYYAIGLKENSTVRQIFVSEPAKRNLAQYAVPDAAGSITIKAGSDSFKVICLGPQRAVLNEKLNILRMVQPATAELYLHFFIKGDRTFELLSYLSEHYVFEKNDKGLNIDGINVLTAMLDQKQLSRRMRMNILKKLGNAYLKRKGYYQAVKYYAEIDETSHDSASIKNQILALQKSGKTALCAEMLIKAQSRLSSAEVLKLTQLIGEETPDIDQRILVYATEHDQWDLLSQHAFARLCVKSSAHEDLILSYEQLAIRHMLLEQVKPEYTVLDLMEKRYLQNPNLYLSLGLSSVYLAHNVQTLKSEQILQSALTYMEEEHILLPIFKEKLKGQVPFIEKHQPFMYQTTSGKQCRLNYKTDASSDVFESVDLKYMGHGMYLWSLAVFYNETVEYYFSEEMTSGSIATKVEKLTNSTPFIHHDAQDEYFAINNAAIYESMFKFDDVEKNLDAIAVKTEC